MTPDQGPVPDLAVVVPVRDEAANILPLLAEIDAALKGVCAFEIVYVDDGSRDETPQRLREGATAHAGLRVLRHRDPCGQSEALTTGIRAARATVIATLDGDGQNDPADIPALYRRLLVEAGADRNSLMIAGLRARRRDSVARRLASRIANGVRSAMLGDATPDTGCGLKLFTRAAFLDMPHFDHMHRFLPALMIRQGGRVVSVPVNHRPRQRGRSKYGVWDRLWVGIVDLFGVMWLKARIRRPIVERDP